MRCLRLPTLVLLAWSLAGSVAFAGLVETTVEMEVTGIEPGLTNFALGDRYLVTFTIDDSVMDTNASTSFGTFPGMVTAWSMAAAVSNVGSWVPTGTPTLPGLGTTNSLGDNMTFAVEGTGYPDGGLDWQYTGVEFYFDWPPTVVDGGSGDTFLEQLGAPFAVPPAAPALNIEFEQFERSTIQAIVELRPVEQSVLEVPSLSTLGLTAFVLLLGWIGLRRLG